MSREETVLRMHELAHRANEVHKFEHTLARMFAEEHPNDPIVAGLHAADRELAIAHKAAGNETRELPQRFSLIQGGAL